MKTLTTILLALALTGCTHKLDVDELKKRTDKCNSNEGAKEIVVWANDGYVVYCNNGAKFNN